MSVEQQTDGGTGEERTYTAPVPRVYRHSYIVNRQFILDPPTVNRFTSPTPHRPRPIRFIELSPQKTNVPLRDDR